MEPVNSAYKERSAIAIKVLGRELVRVIVGKVETQLLIAACYQVFVVGYVVYTYAKAAGSIISFDFRKNTNDWNS